MRVRYYNGYTVVKRVYRSDLGGVEYEVRTSFSGQLLDTFDRLRDAKAFCYEVDQESLNTLEN